MVNAIICFYGPLGYRLKCYADEYLEDEWIWINESNYHRWAGYKFGNLVWTGCIRKDASVEELIKRNITDLLKVIQDFSVHKMIYISSPSVYEGYKEFKKAEPQGYCYKEEMFLPLTNMSLYGQIKALGEYIVSNTYDNWLILRPNEFTGIGFSNDVISALTKSKPYFYYTPDSYSQYIHVDRFAQVLFLLNDSLGCNKEIVNVAPKNKITLLQIAGLLKLPMGCIEIKNPPRFQLEIDTFKMHFELENWSDKFPTNEEAILNWDKNLDILS